MWIQNQQDDNSVAVPVILQTNMRHQKQIPRRLSLRRSKQEYRHCGKKSWPAIVLSREAGDCRILIKTDDVGPRAWRTCSIASCTCSTRETIISSQGTTECGNRISGANCYIVSHEMVKFGVRRSKFKITRGRNRFRGLTEASFSSLGSTIFSIVSHKI